MADWKTKIAFVLAIASFIEAPMFLLLMYDKRWYIILFGVDVALLVLVILLWAPLVTKARAEKITLREVETLYPTSDSVRIERDRTRLVNREWHVFGFIHTISKFQNRDDSFECVLENRSGHLKAEKSKFPNIPRDNHTVPEKRRWSSHSTGKGNAQNQVTEPGEE